MTTKKVREAYKPKVVLENWIELLKRLPEMREFECKEALDVELKNSEPRKDFVLRLHRRFHRLRGERETRQLERLFPKIPEQKP